VGLIKESKEIVTRTGKKMAFAVLETYNAEIELVVFPETFDKYRMLLEPDRIVGVQGKLDKRRGEPKFLVNLLADPSELKPVRHGALHIRLSEDLGEETNLYNLRDLIFDQPGECVLYLHLGSAAGAREWVIRASPAITVSADESSMERMRSNPQVKDVWKE
jgi:DNA polymerase-3 subunit alpha